MIPLLRLCFALSTLEYLPAANAAAMKSITRKDTLWCSSADGEFVSLVCRSVSWCLWALRPWVAAEVLAAVWLTLLLAVLATVAGAAKRNSSKDISSSSKQQSSPNTLFKKQRTQDADQPVDAAAQYGVGPVKNQQQWGV